MRNAKRLAVALLRRHEGLTLTPVSDNMGVVIGHGRNLITRPLAVEEWDALFGWGLCAEQITPEFANWLLARDINEAIQFCSRWRGWNTCGDVRRAALIDAYHAMGTSFGAFYRLRAALGAGDYARVSDEALDSKWGRSESAGVRARVEEIAGILRSGRMPDWYREGE